MNLIVKIHMNQDMADTIKHFVQQISSNLCSVLYLVHPQIKVHISYETKLWPDPNLTRLLLREKKKKKKGGGGPPKNVFKKMHLGQVFQSFTSFETYNLFLLAYCVYNSHL